MENWIIRKESRAVCFDLSEGIDLSMKTTKRMRRQLMELPEEIVFHILSRLPVSSLCCIRCVSKALLHIVDDHFFISLHTARLTTVTNPVADDHHQVPRLMFFARPSNRSEGFLALQSLKYDGITGTLTKGKYAVRVSSSDQSERAVYHVHFVYCNLFFLKDGLHQDCFLLNPLRGGEVLRLPRSPITQHSNFACGDWYGMGFDSTANTHKILHVTWNRQVAEVLVLGTRSWREISSVPPLGLSNKRHVCAYGDMHWLIDGSIGSNYKMKLYEHYEGTSHILSFDFKKEEFYQIPHPTLHSSAKHPHYFHLLTLRGSMAILDASLSRPGGMNMSISIWVLKNYENKQWTLDCTMEIEKLETQPEFGFMYASCGEWEHGIFYKEGFARNTTLFLDLRRNDANRVIRQRECDGYTNIFSYTQSLISLKDYASAGSEELVTEGLKSYGNLIEGEEQGFSISEKQMLRGSSFI